MNLKPDEREVGRENFNEALGLGRRDFLKGVIAAGVAGGAGLGAAYFGYGASVSDPVRIGIIGTGDEGGILIGALNPKYVQVTAICDIRKYSQHRAFHGDALNLDARPGLMAKYDWKSEDEARKHVKVFDLYEDLLKEADVEGVIIALPLHLHHEVAIAAMRAGKHVLTEKLMGHDVAKCKDMARVSAQTGKLLATGHQRHYSVLYDNAVNMLRWGILGELHHIRAQWHRGNLPGKDSWRPPLPGGEVVYDAEGKKSTYDRIAAELATFRANLASAGPRDMADLERKIAQWAAWDADRTLQAEAHGYQTITMPDGRQRSALEELCRWRIWDRTGGGLMAELGSHQLDAATIFCSALRKDGKKAHPIAVHAVSGRHTFPLDRDADDHVYCLFEFPAPGYEADFDVGYRDPSLNYPDPKTGVPPYERDKNKRIVVSYSSINGNGFGGYGEVVMGTKGTLILDGEKEIMLYKSGESASTKLTVKSDSKGPSLMSYETGGGGNKAAAALGATATTGPISRGYTEEIEHWAWCIRNPAPENQPRCRPEVALGDAVIALTARLAGQRAGRDEGGYIRFDESWFDWKLDATPDGSKPAEKTPESVT